MRRGEAQRGLTNNFNFYLRSLTFELLNLITLVAAVSRSNTVECEFE